MLFLIGIFKESLHKIKSLFSSRFPQMLGRCAEENAIVFLSFLT